ncbi:conserved hypothetical protein [Talaromyces stipitatus ATCC 10500]|uniref:xyloglucan-specific endo-beta-1,4-glucanase n=1 Tax=Talaromyces stipitatus (strain ATCC 10500 / CBS 375.48 / QM 6759 / NRRL 1006) TaxID=441959 RepID=B8MR58_TALSN|nr:uncharacterized protein TSTA_054630 [Talaromyces stipitatus ATCC 10500]EED12953.1 conserved hypothetical protein [Talaromyces stipitatus ATCC 10500]
MYRDRVPYQRHTHMVHYLVMGRYLMRCQEFRKRCIYYYSKAVDYTGSNIVADVAYNLFTSYSASGSAQYEIMIWLAALGGANPISSSGSTIATPTIGGITWNLYSRPNGATTVYGFAASSEQSSYSGNLLDFFKYLEDYEGFSSSQYLLSVQAGTEPFTGPNAELYSTYCYCGVI